MVHNGPPRKKERERERNLWTMAILVVHPAAYQHSANAMERRIAPSVTLHSENHHYYQQKKKRANFPSDCTGRLLTSEAPQSWRVQDGRSRVTPPRRHRDLNGRAARPRPLAAFSSRCRHPVCCLAAQRVAPVATTATGRSNRRVLLCCCSPQGKRVQDLNTLSLTSGCRLLLVPTTISSLDPGRMDWTVQVQVQVQVMLSSPGLH